LVDTTIAADEKLRAKADILASIPGIAKVTACAPLTDMPELGKLSGKQAAKIAGLAPISRQSGKWQGKKHIQGGRASVRRAVYLPAVVAKRFTRKRRLHPIDISVEFSGFAVGVHVHQLAGGAGRAHSEVMSVGA
jgi:transposase